ncbi:hypothetical protein PanWU01x14_308540 [Parasponia andersonii]|uniref:Uncharacterized protein n=1 Tax=Parasponia andersonii TaxID=3476 RepID=A0A2P5AQW2_PARAD|nr:hypothetical protein PanWU01x14_308540 [Parasponia andersonii]
MKIVVGILDLRNVEPKMPWFNAQCSMLNALDATNAIKMMPPVTKVIWSSRRDEICTLNYKDAYLKN